VTAVITLSSSAASRIGVLVRLLGSDQPGEVVAAAGALVRALDHVLADVVERSLHHPERLLADRGHGTPLDHSALAHACWRRPLELTQREHDFVANMVRSRHPSVRQAAWLIVIATRLGVARTDYASRHRRN
jgi:hypothetical protein